MSEIQRQFHIPALDGWRGLAILIVLTGHFGGYRVLPDLAPTGVNLFFVLSGRLMAEILFVRKTPLGPFFFHRFSRVYPGLLARCDLDRSFANIIGSRDCRSCLGTHLHVKLRHYRK